MKNAKALTVGIIFTLLTHGAVADGSRKGAIQAMAIPLVISTPYSYEPKEPDPKALPPNNKIRYETPNDNFLVFGGAAKPKDHGSTNRRDSTDADHVKEKSGKLQPWDTVLPNLQDRIGRQLIGTDREFKLPLSADEKGISVIEFAVYEAHLRSLWANLTNSRDEKTQRLAAEALKKDLGLLFGFAPTSPYLLQANMYLHGILRSILASFSIEGAQEVTYRLLQLFDDFRMKSFLCTTQRVNPKGVSPDAGGTGTTQKCVSKEEAKSILFEIASAALKINEYRFQVIAINILRTISEDTSDTRAHRQHQILVLLQEFLDGIAPDQSLVRFHAYQTVSIMNSASREVARFRQQLIFKYLSSTNMDSLTFDSIGQNAVQEAQQANDPETQVRVIQNALNVVMMNLVNPNRASYGRALAAIKAIRPLNARVVSEKAAALAKMVRVAPSSIALDASAILNNEMRNLEYLAMSEGDLNVVQFRMMDELFGGETEWKEQQKLSALDSGEQKSLTQLLVLSGLRTLRDGTFQRKMGFYALGLQSASLLIRTVSLNLIKGEINAIAVIEDPVYRQRLTYIANKVAESLRNISADRSERVWLFEILALFKGPDSLLSQLFQPESIAKVLNEVLRLGEKDPLVVQAVRDDLAGYIRQGDMDCGQFLRALSQ